MLAARQSVLRESASSFVRPGQAIVGQQIRFASGFDATRNDRERVVVLGSGWAGYTLARELDKSKYQVVVVSPRTHFVFTPLLASTSVGTLEFRTAIEPVRTRRTNVEFLQGWADSVDFVNKSLVVEENVADVTQATALTADKSDIENHAARPRKGKVINMNWDKLVIAVGCYSQTFNTPGVRENAYFLKDVGDARRIRNRVLTCFEKAALPTTSVEMKKALLNFAVVGGGPTGIEWSAELHDIIQEDLRKIYPELVQYCQITVYDVADKVLNMFDEKLANYAMNHFKREGIRIRTSHHVLELRQGVPKKLEGVIDEQDAKGCYTMNLKEEGEVAVGMCVWSTGLMMNPFISRALRNPYKLPGDALEVAGKKTEDDDWLVTRHPRSGAVITNDRMQVKLQPKTANGHAGRAILKNVYALGDCASIEDTMLPATAQVANQKARWLSKHLNNNEGDEDRFTYRNLGVMAYVGNWNAIMQSNTGDVSGRFAWLIWRFAYLTKSVSWRNTILIPTYWFINWVFGRDISRF